MKPMKPVDDANPEALGPSLAPGSAGMPNAEQTQFRSKERPAAAPWQSPSCLIYCDGVCRQYPDGAVRALDGVTLGIDRGEYVAIMGPSGSGKSTLLNLIAGLDRPTAGEVYFEGTPLAAAAFRNRLRVDRIGFVFQSFNLLATLTASENVQVPMFEGPLSASARRRKAVELLGLVGLGHRLNHLPSQLSGGEKQRVAVARALANDPIVLLADEPTGNLDTASGEEVLALFDRLHAQRGLTPILVTHSPEVGGRARRLIRLRDGRVVEDRRTPAPAAQSQP
jgi:putative ABC transport system ATP-binding protein